MAPSRPRLMRPAEPARLIDRKELPKILNMNINFFANLFRLSRLLGKSGHSFLVTTRRRSRDFLVTTVTESFYLAMYFTFLVFIVGLAASLKWRYKDQLVSGFVRNNLPAVGNPSNQITWETFEHIGSKELTPQQRGPLSLVVDSPFVERIDVYNDSLIIKPQTPWEKLKGQRYIGFYMPSPSPHAQSAFNISSSTTDLSHPPLGGEASRPLGPSSVLDSSARLHVPARGFVEFSPLAHTLPLVDHASQGCVSQASQVFGVPSDGSGVSMQGRSSNPLAPVSKFENPAGLTKSFNVGSYPLTTRPTLMVTISDQDMLDAAASHSHGLSGILGSAHRKVGVFSLSPIKKWFYQFYGQLDEIPYKLGSTKLLPDNFAVIERAKPIQRNAEPLGGLEGLIENSRRSSLAAPGHRGGEEPTADKLVQRNAEPVQRNAELLERLPGALSNALGDSYHQFQVPLDRLQDCGAGTTSASLQVGTSKLSKSWMRRVEPIPGYADSLIGVKSMGPFGQELQGAGVRSPQNLGGATAARKALPSSHVHPVHPEGMQGMQEQGVEPFRTRSHATEVAPPRLVGLAMKRQAFTKEALLLLGSDGLVGQRNQDWEPLPLLLNELNSTEVATAVEEGVKALDMGWEEVLALLSDSVSGFTGLTGVPGVALLRNARPAPPRRSVGRVRRSDGRMLQAMKQAPTRLMSGYSYPDSTRTKLVRDLTHWAVRYGFDLRKAATTLLLAEKEILLPASLSLPLAHSAAQDSTGAKRRTDRQMMPLPLVEIDYRPISLSGLASLRDVLSGLKIESLESELDDIPMLETTYQGPAVARDKITNDLVGIGREELAAWVAKAIQGYGRSLPSGVFVDPEATLSLRQSNRLGKKEVLRGEPLVHEKVLAAVRPRLGVDTGIRRDKTEEADNSIEPASSSLQPMKSNKIGPEQFLTGSGPKLKDPSQVVALERGDEAPLYPLEIVLTKAAPLFEEEQEVLSLEPDEWRNIFKGVVVQAIENKASLDKIEVLLPSIAMVQRGPGMRLEGENRAGLSGLGVRWDGAVGGAEPPHAPQPPAIEGGKVGGGAWGSWGWGSWGGEAPPRPTTPGHRGGGSAPPTPPTHAKQHPNFDNQLQKSYLVDKHDCHLGQHTDPPVKADELTRVLTSQEYANLAVLIAQSKRFVGECNYWPIADPRPAEGLQKRFPGFIGMGKGDGEGPLHHSPLGQGPQRPARGVGGYRSQASGYSSEHELMNDQGDGTVTRSAKRRTRPTERRTPVRPVRPRLLCHYLPLSQVAIPESSTKQPISAGNYHKRLTSFTARYPFNRQPYSSSTSSSFRLTEQPTAVWPVVESKQQMFYQLWEPVTANSWMMFYKLCFAFWIQEMGKDFYKRYGKEIILYAVNLLVALGFDAQGIIEDLGLEESPIRVITNGKRRFGDIAGIDSILPELGEIVWFLRSSGRGGQVPKGILLVGPPGTGKTFVVQAIAGEAKVPVLVQSASSLTDSGQKQSGSQKLRDLFDRARQLSPCILFIDEIDTLGVSRPHVIGNTMGADELLESIEGGGSQQEDATSLTGAARGLGQLNDATPELDPYLSFPPSPRASSESMLDGDEDDRPRDEAPVFREGEGDPQDSPGLDPSVIEVIESHNEERRTRQERLALLMQFLMEMDGLRALHGVVVIGATNRPAVLDPAFTRPGRFERILCLPLPGKQKRIEVLKLYSKNLGFTNVIPSVNVNQLAGGAWDYLANRTAGWSAAHLAAAMNQSAIRAIIQETAHTIETVEHGISAIARRSFQASSDQSPHALAGEAEATVNGLLNPDMPFLTVTVFQQSSDSMAGSSLGWRSWGGSAPPRPKGDRGLTGLTGVPGVALQSNARPAPPRRFAERDDHWSANLSVKLSQTSTGSHRQGTGLAGNRGPLSIARWAYYQAGKAVLQTALPLHPPAAFFPLRPQPFVKSSSDLAKLVASTYQQRSLEPHRRVVLETRLIGLYAGKASEMLALSAYARAGERANAALFESCGEGTSPHPSLPSRQKQSQGTSISQSDLGIEELTFAGVVANLMISSWYLYSKRVALQRLNLSTIARNTEEIDDPVLLDLFRHLEEDQEHQVERATRHSQRFQQWSSPSWWQTQVMVEAALVEPGYSEWYRIYIPDPEETERNIDWVPPEDHYHAATANQLRNVAKRARTGVRWDGAVGVRRPPPAIEGGALRGGRGPHAKQPHAPQTPAIEGATKSTLSQAPTNTNRGIRHRSMGSLTAITWNDLYLINRDYIYHGLINSCFQKAFLLLDKRRELVDFLSDHLIRYDLLRQYEIEQICSNFSLDERPSTDTTGNAHPSDETPNPLIETLGGGLGPCPQPPSEEMRSQLDTSLPADRKLSSFENSPRIAQSLQHSSYIVEADWGSTSRRQISRFIDFDFVKPCYLKRVS
uniref:Cell division protein n=1 Tax=Paradoxia multiseta TaxID=249350 RepID=A0A097KP24_9CHLO|nr:cell division protein [Paradoxia multiseta]AIT94912.1 cell division protein [Paradoxia multiseta]